MSLPKINETVTGFITIPSTKAKLEFRPYYAKEEKLLLMAHESKDRSLMITTISNTIKACSLEKINVDKLTFFDIQYIFIQLRSMSVGETSEIQVPCRNPEPCDNYQPHIINLEDIAVDDLMEKDVRISDKYTVTMRYPGFKDFDYLLSITEDDSNQIEHEFNMTARCVEYVKGIDDLYDFSEITNEEREEWLGQLKPKQLQKLKPFVTNQPRLYYSIDFTCSKCGFINKQIVREPNTFF